MPRFFLENINTDNPVLTGEDARHIGRSLRMKPGEKITVCSCGTDYFCEIRYNRGYCIFKYKRTKALLR